MEHLKVNVNAHGIALLELDRPDILNVLNVALLKEMRTALESLGSREDVTALIITGRGRGFCAGADLSALAAVGVEDSSLGQQISDLMLQDFNPVMQLLYEFPRPVITAVNGIAAGGGAALALCADIVLAAQSAALKVVQVPQLGIVADLGANWLLPRMAGRSRALGACLTGDTLPAKQLYDWGLLWECVEDEALLGRAVEIAGRLSGVPSATLLATRRLVDDAWRESFSAIIERERQYQEELCDQPFFADAVAKFLAK